MRYRILRNECKEYRIEKQQFGQGWKLLTTGPTRAFEHGVAGNRVVHAPAMEFKTYQEARDHIQDLIEAPDLERKRKAWSEVEIVEAPDER